METTTPNWVSEWVPPVIEPKAEKVIEPLKIGDIYVAQWGYEANIVQFYKITNISKQFVTLRECESKFVGAGNFYDARLKTCGEVLENKPSIRTKIRKDGNGFYFKLTNYKFAHKWDGRNETEYNHH